MMQTLIDTLHIEDCTLVILHEGNVSTFSGQGLRRLYNIFSTRPELLLSAKVAIKALGRSAARMMVDGGVVEVWADVISQQACDLLKDNGVVVNYERKVDHNTFLDIWQRLGELDRAS